ncbi:MAG: condensation domain-containing protein, partial [Acidobacteriota bacterium]
GRAETQPEQLAYIFLQDGEKEERRLTYHELDRQARAIAALLQSYHARGERALLLYPPGLEFIAAFFGCLYSGVIAVPVYPPDPARLNRTLPRLMAIANDAKPIIALTTSEILSLVEYLFSGESEVQAIRWLATDNIELALAEQWQRPEIDISTLAFLQYTSGSTALPKGVMISHGNLMQNELMIQQAFQLNESSIGVGWLPLYHDMGLIGNVIQPLYAGFPCVLMSPLDFLQRPLRWLQAISQYRATSSGGPNFAYDLCVRKITPEQRASLDLSCWRLAFNGAEPVRPETLEQFAAAFAASGFRREAFYPCYGLAEATLFVAGGVHGAAPVVCTIDSEALEENSIVEALPAQPYAVKLIGCGQSPVNQQIVIVDSETATLCPSGQVGEIWVTGPAIAQGYWHRPEETAYAFQAYLADTGIGPFLRTGDLGFLKNGELFITGRLKDLIIIRGRNHYPQDIEQTVEKSYRSLRPGCSAAFSINIDGEERLIVVAEVERRYHTVRRAMIENRQKLESRTTDRRQLKLDPGFETDTQVPLHPQAITWAIRSAIAEQHDLHAHTVVLVSAGSIPKTSSGKIQRHACREAFLTQTLDVVMEDTLELIMEVEVGKILDRQALLAAEVDFHQCLMEAHLCARIAQTLNLSTNSLQLDQPINSLGIDSLMAIELKNQLENDFGVSLPIIRFLKGDSICQLSSWLLEQIRNSPPLALSAQAPVTEYALSYGQKSLWFLHQLAPTSAAYNLFFAVRILSKLDVPALQRAFQALLNRHLILRTIYLADGGEQRQQILECHDINFNVVDATTWSWEELNERLVTTAHKPFDLEKGPLLRVDLFTRAESEQILLLTVHHIAIDLWSLLILVDELGRLYPAELVGTRAALPYLGLQYTDYVRWQAEMLAGPAGAEHWAYWQKQLSGELPVLHLPTDRTRPPVQTYRGASFPFRIDGEITEQLKTLAISNATTLYTVLLSAYQVLLHRYSGQQDILVGSPAVGRSHTEFGGIVGYFVNPVVIRAFVTDNGTFQEFLAHTRETVLAVLEHHDYPFPLLVEKLQPVRDASRSPIFQVMFVLEKPNRLQEQGIAPFVLAETGAHMELGGLLVESLALKQRIAQFDLTLMAVEVSDGLIASWQFNSDLFDEITVARMVSHYKRLLQAIVDCPLR